MRIQKADRRKKRKRNWGAFGRKAGLKCLRQGERTEKGEEIRRQVNGRRERDEEKKWGEKKLI